VNPQARDPGLQPTFPRPRSPRGRGPYCTIRARTRKQGRLEASPSLDGHEHGPRAPCFSSPRGSPSDDRADDRPRRRCDRAAAGGRAMPGRRSDSRLPAAVLWKRSPSPRPPGSSKQQPRSSGCTTAVRLTRPGSRRGPLVMQRGDPATTCRRRWTDGRVPARLPVPKWLPLS